MKSPLKVVAGFVIGFLGAICVSSYAARNGSGTYTLPAGNPVVTGTTISSTWANDTLADIRDAITQSVSKDGQTAMTGNLSLGSNRITNVGNASAAADAVSRQFGDARYLLVTGFPNVAGNVTPTHTELNYVDGVTSAIQTQLDAKLASASYTAADVLSKLLTVDGSGAGVDADLLDGVSSAGFAQVANNLSDVTASTARTNLGVTATGSDTTYNYRANNLSDVANAGTARGNLGAAASATTVSVSGTGLSGGGDLSTNRTITIDQTAMTTRNITGKTGVAKTLSTSAPSGGADGDIWYVIDP